MPAEMKINLTNNYKSTLKDLKERLVEELGDKLDSIILYGSVARGDFGSESDIDLLLIVEDKRLIDKVYEIGYGVDIKNNTVTSILIYSSGELRKNIKLGAPFVKNVISEGKIVYDNRTWEQLRSSLVGAGR
jgi:uncharacterized protein